MIIVFGNKILTSVSPHSDILRVGVTLAGHQKKILNSVQMMRAQMNQIQSVEVWPSRAEQRGDKRRLGCRALGAEDGVEVFLCVTVCLVFPPDYHSSPVPLSTSLSPPLIPLTLTLPPSVGSAVETRSAEASEGPQTTHLWRNMGG